MKKKRYGKLALFLTAMLWGTTFAIGKIATEVFSASFVIALRFTVASIALIIVAAPLYKLLNKEYKRILLVATGALLSSLSTQQGESIPSIAHLVAIES
jgi:drug/metabolite transporter (DMT)-like permease